MVYPRPASPEGGNRLCLRTLTEAADVRTIPANPGLPPEKREAIRNARQWFRSFPPEERHEMRQRFGEGQGHPPTRNANTAVPYRTAPSVRPVIREDRFARLLDSAGCIPQNHRTQ